MALARPLSVTKNVENSLILLGDGRLVSAGETDGLRVWAVGGQGEPATLAHRDGQLEAITALAILTDRREARKRWRLKGNVKLWRLDGPGEPVLLRLGYAVQDLLALRDGRLVTSVSDFGGGAITVWDFGDSGEPAPVTLESQNWGEALAQLADGRLVVAGEHPELWSLAEPFKAVALPLGWSTTLAALGDGRLASGDADAEGGLRLWDPDFSRERAVGTHGDRIFALAVLEEDERLVSGGQDGDIKIWRNNPQSQPVTLSHGDPVYTLALLRDGRLASGSRDGTIKLWSPEGSAEPARVLKHGALVRALAVLPDGRMASGGADGLIKLWQVNEGEADRPTLPPCRPQPHRRGVEPLR